MSIRGKLLTGVVCGAASLVMSSAASASITYTNKASFVAALNPGYYLETFESLPTFSSFATPHVFSGGAFSYSASTTAQAFFSDTIGDRFISTSGATDGFSRPITLTFTGAPVRAIGGNYFTTDAFGHLQTDAPNSNIILNFADGFSTTLVMQDTSTFFGYIGNAPLASITIAPNATHRFVCLDDIYVGGSNVPEPTALGALAVAWALLLRRR